MSPFQIPPAASYICTICYYNTPRTFLETPSYVLLSFEKKRHSTRGSNVVLNTKCAHMFLFSPEFCQLLSYFHTLQSEQILPTHAKTRITRYVVNLVLQYRFLFCIHTFPMPDPCFLLKEGCIRCSLSTQELSSWVSSPLLCSDLFLKWRKQYTRPQSTHFIISYL